MVVVVVVVSSDNEQDISFISVAGWPIHQTSNVPRRTWNVSTRGTVMAATSLIVVRDKLGNGYR